MERNIKKYGLLGQEIYKHLKRLRLSQRELAAKAMISQGNISKLMRDEHRPNADTLVAIAQVLNVDPLHLMRIAGLPLPKPTRNPSVEYVAQRLDELPDAVQGVVISGINAQLDVVAKVYQQAKKEAVPIEDDPRDEKIFSQISPLSHEAVEALRQQAPDDYEELMTILRQAYDLLEARKNTDKREPVPA